MLVLSISQRLTLQNRNKDHRPTYHNTAILGAFVKICPRGKYEKYRESDHEILPGRAGEMNIKAAHASFDAVCLCVPAKIRLPPKWLPVLEVGGYGALKDVSSWRVFTPDD